jgi:hypothetical protein
MIGQAIEQLGGGDAGFREAHEVPDLSQDHAKHLSSGRG